MPYAWAKAAVHSLAQGLRGELEGSGVAVSCICPGVVVSAMSKKVGAGWELAARPGQGSVFYRPPSCLPRPGGGVHRHNLAPRTPS